MDEQFDLIISVTYKRGYEGDHFIRVNDDDIEFCKKVCHVNTIEEVVKSFTGWKSIKKVNYYKYKGERHVIK